MPTRHEVKRFRGLKLARQDTNFGYWWYGTEEINIALVTELSGGWTFTVEFLLASVEVKVKGDTEKKVRRSMSLALNSLKAGVALL